MTSTSLLQTTSRWLLVPAFGLAAMAVDLAGATPTENFGLRLLPAPAGMKIDGDVSDWNLAAGIFASDDVEAQREELAVWVHGAYDADNLYILARFRDRTPMNHPGDSRRDFGWEGDSLQLRVIMNYGAAGERVVNLTCWRDAKGVDVVELSAPGVEKNSPAGANIKLTGAKQAFREEADGSGYVQELSIPWSLLNPTGPAPVAGESIVLTVEPNFSVGENKKRLSVKDIFRPEVPIDRVFTFRATRTWGVARLLPANEAVEPLSVRLADRRLFPVAMIEGKPVIDWTGLEQGREAEGVVPVSFTLKEDGFVSLNISNEEGKVVRQLLTANPFKAGEHTISWDGLTTPNWRTPGEGLPEGRYTWKGITHPGIGVKLRGFASSAARVPWDDGPGSNWGGDMGNPCAVATEGDRVLLGWGMAEAGRAAVLADLEGAPVWGHKRGGIGGARFVALDAGVAYVIDPSTYGNQLGAHVYKLAVADASVVPFTASGAGELMFRTLAGGDAGLAGVPSGFAVKAGRMYLSSSSQAFFQADIADWRALLKETAGAENPLWSRLQDSVRERITGWLKSDESVEKGLSRRGNTPDTRVAVVRALNELVDGPALSSGEGEIVAAANRRWLERRFPGIAVRVTDFVAIIDAASGVLERRITVPGAGALLATDNAGVYALTAGRELVFVEATTGKIRTVVKGLADARALARDAKGNFYIGLAAPENRIEVYSAAGKKLRTIGRKGGRPETGRWRADGFREIAALAVDARGVLWVAEDLDTPRRFSTWDAASGKLLREYFGPTHYGASGGAILPSDPNVMAGEGTEWLIDPRTGRAGVSGVYDNKGYNFSRFAKGENGRVYLAGIRPASRTDPIAEPASIRIFERLGAGDYRLRASIKTWPADSRAKTQGRSEFWADANDDQQEQRDEIQSLDSPLVLGGYYFWSMNVAADLTFTGGSGHLHRPTESVRIKTGGFTTCGAPVYDLKAIERLPIAAGPMLPSLDGRLLLVDGNPLQMVDQETGSVRWTYPNEWSGVHGSHRAPESEPGLFRGAFGIVGTAKLPAPVGDIWAFNSNVGEWHLVTGEGFYLSRLFRSEWLKLKFPKEAVPGADLTGAPAGLGGEDFGGSLVQGDDGKVYVQAGKTALWNTEVTGLDRVRALPGGSLVLSESDVRKAAALREERLQAAVGTRSMEVKRLTPAFSGDLERDFKGAQIVGFKKTEETTVRTALAWDDDHLYVAWEVRDATPWVNGADRPEYMYARGDTVDLQLGVDAGADPKRGEAGAGDVRLSIGSFGGTPTAVIYRKTATDKSPMTFSSGVIADYVMDSVKIAPDVRVHVKKGADRYVIEAAIPLAQIGVKPAAGLALRGDVGVTYGDQAGMDTRMRSHWSNQATGLVDDEVFELKMNPVNWGELKFVP